MTQREGFKIYKTIMTINPALYNMLKEICTEEEIFIHENTEKDIFQDRNR